MFQKTQQALLLPIQEMHINESILLKYVSPKTGRVIIIECTPQNVELRQLS